MRTSSASSGTTLYIHRALPLDFARTVEHLPRWKPGGSMRVRSYMAGMLAWSALAGAASSATGGPDALGMTWADQDDGCPIDSPVLTFAAQVFLDPLTAIGPISLGFAMPFAGRVVTQVWISPSGFVSFSDQGAAGASTATQLLPDPLPPNDLVAPYWKPALAPEVDAEAFPDRFVIGWRRDEGAPRLTPAWLTLWHDGRMEMSWGNRRFGGSDATLGYENLDGSLGTTYWRDGVAIEPGFGGPQYPSSLCLTPPALLDCAAPQSVACGDDVDVVLPSSLPRQAQVYSCSSVTYPGLERVVRLDLAAPSRVTMTIDRPDCDLLLVSAPPACSEARCLAMADQTLDIPVAFAGPHLVAIDRTTPGGGVRVRLQVACTPLPVLSCGSSATGTTAGGPLWESSYACVPVALDGPEASYLVTTTSAGHLALTLPGSTPGLWVVVRDVTGACLAAEPGGVTLWDAPAATYVVTVDGERSAAGPFTLRAECGTRLQCPLGAPITCGARLTGDTSRSANDRADIYGCSRRVLDGREDVFLLDVPAELVVSVRFLGSQPGQEILVLRDCDESHCAFGPDQGACAPLPPGLYVLVVDGPAGGEGPYELVVTCDRDSAPGIDLRAKGVDVSALRTDCRDLSLNGVARVRLVNDGRVDANAPFDVVTFLDLDASGVYMAGADTLLGTSTVTTDVLAGEERVVDVAAAGVLPFRDALIHAQVDPSRALRDVDRSNDVTDSGKGCVVPAPPALPIALRAEWAWSGSRTDPTFVEVESIPLVGDLDGDGLPEVVFCAQEPAGSPNTGCMVRAVSGRDGSDVWTADAPAARFRVATAPAIGDLDGDGRPEIVGQSHLQTNRLICLDSSGALKWTSDPMAVQNVFDTYSGAPAIADLDGDGSAEVVWGPNAFRADGRAFWTADSGGTLGSNSGGPISIVADVDGDGVQEVIAGPTAYKLDTAGSIGAILWTNASVPDGFDAAGNLDDDAELEVAIASPYRLDVLEAESGAIKWTVPLPSGGGAPCGGFASTAGGPPTIADADGDGAPDILVVVADWLACFSREGALEWKAPIQECSSGTTSVTVFDLDGDGRKEIILKDEVAIRILRGEDGSELTSEPGTSGTAREMPVVADVDGDGQAEILVVDNRLLGGSGVGLNGVRCFGSASSPWVRARATWNQHAYHVTNIEADLSVPVPSNVPCRPPSPFASGTFRVQRQAPQPGPLGPDVTLTLLMAERVRSSGCAQDLHLVLRVGNGGGRSPGGPVPLALFDGDPASGGALLLQRSVADLLPGAYEDLDVVVSVSATSPVDVVALADADMSGASTLVECREDNNGCVVTDAEVGAIVPVPPPVDVGPALRATMHGDPHAAVITARFDWSRDAGAPRPLGTGAGQQHYHVLRGAIGPRPPVLALVPGTEPWLALTYDDSTPATPAARLPHVWAYVVVAADACERVSRE